jgi:hypothetical protein
MVVGMATRKVTITLPEEVIERAAGLAKQEGLALSTWISHAAEHQARIQDGLAAIAEWEAEVGPITAAERAAARAEITRVQQELIESQRLAG